MFYQPLSFIIPEQNCILFDPVCYDLKWQNQTELRDQLKKNTSMLSKVYKDSCHGLVDDMSQKVSSWVFSIQCKQNVQKMSTKVFVEQLHAPNKCTDEQFICWFL